MAKHDDLLKQGPREAPEPETAEERSQPRGHEDRRRRRRRGRHRASRRSAILGKFFI